MITPVIPNKRACLLQYLQTPDGHHGILAMKRKPMFVNQRTEHRSLSGFSFLQLAQINMAKTIVSSDVANPPTPGVKQNPPKTI
jgi:hypothetical protein